MTHGPVLPGSSEVNVRDVRFVDVLTFALGLTAVAALIVCLAPRRVVLAQSPAASDPAPKNAPIEEFDRLMTDLSNWGRWGKDDQKGALNLITPAKRKQSLAVVKDGISVSMARNAETEPALDNPQPIVVKMAGRGGSAARGANAPATAAPNPISGASDNFFISYHGFVHTHMDTFCHRAYKGKMYNGMPMTEVNESGCNMGSIINFKDGIVTRGVLSDCWLQ